MNRPVAPLGPVDYSSTVPPATYVCGGCGAAGVKLWREYNTVLDVQSMLCCDCTMVGGEAGDQIGWRFPAVPSSDGETYRDYTSVPDDGYAWWYRLPLRVLKEAP